MRTISKCISIVSIAIAASLGAAQADDDPIGDRQAIMSSVGAAAGLGGGLMKGEIAYSPAAGKAAIAAMRAASLTFGDYFPNGSNTGDTEAAPAIWDNRAGFDAEIAKFAAATGTAMEAAGRAGPADLDAFKAAMGPVFGTCKSCHEGFRVKN
ncbi:c-type cytochrome [Roseibium alexandrii]|uniref:Cytochrome c556 n=1 Tax=Roseibium alexandrii (strain DSM 17067 / NCIMB 14079 / DFL-11) TaxID=244592 RepID=A0A5E8H599_ROSAD|nr:cytochrome c [Roseibium alexandrii]EEE47256.1 Cytochrome c556 [Roseibium alexandrii DFL-11]